MYLLLTDILTCPRCGPELGVVLLADRIDERRVIEGRLGCANCREQYPIHGGVLDVRLPGAAATGDAPAAADASETAVRLAALLGLAGAQGTVLVAGAGTAVAARIRALVPEVEVVALSAHVVEEDEQAGVSRIAGPSAPLPFRAGTLRGVALTAGADRAALEEAVRVVHPNGRVVVENAGDDAAEVLAGLGAEVMLQQEGTVVARVAGRPVQLRINSVR
jgi:uncharacterized protein YbaR (Trm112 family)